MYLMLSVAGHLTIFQTRTRGPWWSTRPAWILLGAVCGTQAIATLIAVYGFGLVTPLGWKFAGMVWAYAFTWFLVTDPVKLLAYKVLDRFQPNTKTLAKATSDADAESKSQLDAKSAPNPNAETKQMPPAEPNAAATPDPKPEAKNLFVESTRQWVRRRLRLSVVLHAVPGKATIRTDHH
jgi:H+-transporting ATPase